VNLAGQQFLEVIDCTHMGNGRLYLYEIRRGFVNLKMSARVITNLGVLAFEPRLARIDYRELEEGRGALIVEADLIDRGEHRFSSGGSGEVRMAKRR
jgi:hypothetical protein